MRGKNPPPGRVYQEAEKKSQSISAMNVGRRSILGNRWNIS